MAEINDVYGSICQNLIDAGCDTKTIKQCMACAKEERYSDILPFLMQYRTLVLSAVHTGQKRIDCLDFLIYKLKNFSSKEQ